MKNKYALEDFTVNEKMKNTLRRVMRDDMMKTFFKMILNLYGTNVTLTPKFLEREYNRVGFNKIGTYLKYIVKFI